MLETNEERFKVLFWKYQNLIIQVALNRTEDLFCAQDICQETFLKLFARVDLGQEDEVLKAWMIVVADNAAKDVLRKGGRYKQVSEDDVEFSEALRVRVSGSSYFDEIIRNRGDDLLFGNVTGGDCKADESYLSSGKHEASQGKKMDS